MSTATELPQAGIDVTAAPDFWITEPDRCRAVLESLPGVTVEEIGTTAGGRTIIAASYGEREVLPGRTSISLPSSICGRDLESFYGQGERQQQVSLFLGGVHGTEWDGTVAALHYFSILATGKDLCGREQPEMAAAGRQHRHLFIPYLNVDGRERILDHVNWINCDPDYFMMMSQGLMKDGRILKWPTSKRLFPIPPDEAEHIGTYYNDNGANLVYDTAMGGDSQPETTALLRYLRRELPDLVICSHSNNGSLVMEPSDYVPEYYRLKIWQMGATVGMRCHKDGFPKTAMPQHPVGYAGEVFYQTDLIYHSCGAVPVLVEFPCGWQNLPDNHQEILDIGLAVLDELAIFGAKYKFKPRGRRG